MESPHAPTVKLTDRRWWATQTPERLARTAALLGIHPGLSAPDTEAIAVEARMSAALILDDYRRRVLARLARERPRRSILS